MDDNTVNTPQPRQYLPYETCFAWFSILAGYLFCRVFPVTVHPLGGLMYIVILYVAAAVMVFKRRGKLSFMSGAAFFSGLALSFTLVFTSGELIHFFTYLYALGAGMYFVYHSTGNALEPGFSELIFSDILRAMFVLPFSSFGQIFSALAVGKGKSGLRFLLRIVAGIALALIPTVLIVSLLTYDRGFAEIIDGLLHFDVEDVFSHLGSLVLGIPVGMYIYGLYASASAKKGSSADSAQRWRDSANRARFAPVVTVAAAVVPILAVYCIFFSSQWQYYVSGFSGVLPDGFTYADYAREGFFQLCTVSAINFLLIIAIGAFSKRESKLSELTLRVLSCLLALSSLILISTAMSKMQLYIDSYGLTPLRVYSSWFMLMLAVLFVLVIIKQFAFRFRLLPVALSACILLYACLAFSGINSLIARYNVDRYIDGTLDSIDYSAMSDLGDAAVPQLVRLAEYLDEKNGTDICEMVDRSWHSGEDTASWRSGDNTAVWQDDDNTYSQLVLYLRACADGYSEELSLFSQTLPRLRAERALADLGLLG